MMMAKAQEVVMNRKDYGPIRGRDGEGERGRFRGSKKGLKCLREVTYRSLETFTVSLILMKASIYMAPRRGLEPRTN